MYANPEANDYDEITTSGDHVLPTSGSSFCGEDLNKITTAVLTEGVDNVVSRAGQGRARPGRGKRVLV